MKSTGRLLSANSGLRLFVLLRRCTMATRRTFFTPLLMGVLVFGPQSCSHASQTNFEVIKSMNGLVAGPSELLAGKDGNLYGTMGEGVFELHKDGSGDRVLHRFAGLSNQGDGEEPVGLVQASDGTLYGTTRSGGSRGGVLDLAGMAPFGNGTVFRINKDGSDYAVLHRFTGANGDGSGPWAGVVEGLDGALYGTTLEDSRQHTGVYGAGHGTVFKLNKDGSGYRVLHTFGVTTADGDSPFAALLAGSDGALYGVTHGGGNSGMRNGTLFKLNQDGSGYRVLHNFPDNPGDGRFPRSRLLEGRNGALYGTTQAGGTNDAGTVFKLDKDGRGYARLHSFSYEGDGAEPQALVEGNDGVLYGTTKFLGKDGAGTVFKMNPDGSGFTILHSFTISQPITMDGNVTMDGNGANPCGALAHGTDGAFYGITQRGGRDNAPIVFKLSLSASHPAPAPASK